MESGEWTKISFFVLFSSSDFVVGQDKIAMYMQGRGRGNAESITNSVVCLGESR